MGENSASFATKRFFFYYLLGKMNVSTAIGNICSPSGTLVYPMALTTCSIRSYCHSSTGPNSDPSCSDLALLNLACTVDSDLLSSSASSTYCPPLTDLCSGNKSMECNILTSLFSKQKSSSSMIQSDLLTMCQSMDMAGCSPCVNSSKMGSLKSCDSLFNYGLYCRVS